MVHNSIFIAWHFPALASFWGLTDFIWATKAYTGAAINAEVPSY
jgi:hypothetical protein